MTYDLSGKVIWLIGASFGIGAQLAKDLSRQGAILCISARSEDALRQVAERCATPPLIAPCDVTSLESITAAYGQIKEQHTRIDRVIYNAGAYDPTSSLDFDLDTVFTMIDVNLHGAIRVLHTILPDMKAQNSGGIVLVGSIAGYKGLPKAMGYGASKAAIMHLAENLKQDLGTKSNITVQLISPGFVKTRLTDKNDFDMPMRISVEDASRAIIRGLQRQDYEIHFPKRFTYIIKFLSLLPNRLYFWLSEKLL
jgi:short-subunit dehydrogenase